MKKLIIDGNTAASMAAYALSETAAIYPITPSSTMAENCSAWADDGKKNIFNTTVDIVEMQSEGGAAGALHGMASAGTLAVTFTASQGLLLMIPNMYKLAGELLPCVIHVSARTIATHALSIFGDHSDVYSCRQTGFLILCSNSVQEAYDNAIIAHLAAIETSIPVLHFFDGFRTSHETNECFVLENEEIAKLVNFEKIEEFKSRALNSKKPFCQGTAQNPDIFFQNREAANKNYFAALDKLKEIYEKFGALTGRKYKTAEYYGNKNAQVVAVAMGSGVRTLKKVAEKEGFGVIAVRAFRPFDAKAICNLLPQSCKTVCVLDRAKEPATVGEPLFVEVSTALKNSGKTTKVIGGRFGLGGKDFTPAQAYAVFKNAQSENAKTNFTVGIVDDVTNLSLEVDQNYECSDNTFSAKFFGLGSDGTVSANKNSIKIIGEHANKHVQAYFEYDSKKSGSITTSHLRFGNEPIDAPYLITDADFIACHNESFVHKIEMAASLKQGGTFVLNTGAQNEELNNFLPNALKETLKQKNAQFYTINAFSLAKKLGLGSRINLIMQSVFFKLIGVINFEEAKNYMKEMAKKTYATKGEKVINANLNAIEEAVAHLNKIELSKLSQTQEKMQEEKSEYYTNFVAPIAAMRGNNLKVSSFCPSGKVPTGTTCEEKRNIAEALPKFIPENCIQCNQCAFVCPHATIRPVLVSDEELKKAPKSFETKKAMQLEGFNLRMQLYPEDCTGCGSCASVCPARQKALVMVNKNEIYATEKENLAFAKQQQMPKCALEMPLNVRTSQFKKPYFEFNGACAGCGETPYIKLLTQLYGKNLIIANATGCTSIYGGNAPTCPYAKDGEGCGPAWANSLFEDNAEFGYGIYLAYKTRRRKIFNALSEFNFSGEEKQIVEEYLNNFTNTEITNSLASSIKQIAQKHNIKTVLTESDAIGAQTVFIVGGDGWAYDIGFGGLDHVLASGENVKVLVLDTEVYSNTGGQASKATQLGAVARFADGGKRSPKKRLGEMMLSYGSVFVAEVAMGANMQHTLDVFKQAVEYNGPAIIIAYATCINQGLNLSEGMKQMKRAHECGYLNLYTYNPSAPVKFKLFGKEPDGTLQDFLGSEIRFKTLAVRKPEVAKQLFEEAKENAKKRFDRLKTIEQQLNK